MKSPFKDCNLVRHGGVADEGAAVAVVVVEHPEEQGPVQGEAAADGMAVGV